MEEEQTGSKRKPPSCSRCSNHGKDSPLTHHKCLYESCECLLCRLTWVRKAIMRTQQQLWRQRKETQKWEEANTDASGNFGELDSAEETGGKQKEKYCDMCRNHGVMVRNRGHKRSCKFENCSCSDCDFTRKRRQVMQLQQKVKRSKITTHQFQEANDWVSKLIQELSSIGINDAPMVNVVTPMPSSSTSCASSSPSSSSPSKFLPPSLPPPPHQPNPQHGQFQHPPPPPATLIDTSFRHAAPPQPPPSAMQGGVFAPPIPLETFPSPSCTRMNRTFMPSSSVQPPPPPTDHQQQQYHHHHHQHHQQQHHQQHQQQQQQHYIPTTAFSLESASPSSSVSVEGVPQTFGGTSGVLHMPMENLPSTSSSCASVFASFCPSPPYTASLSASPMSDYDPSTYQRCPSPLSVYMGADTTLRDMAPSSSHQQPQTCPIGRSSHPAEPLDCRDHHMMSCRSHKQAESRHHEHIENLSTPINRSLCAEPHCNPAACAIEQRNATEMPQGMYWLGQRRKSDGIIPPVYHQSQRRNSDSIIQGIYRPIQRRSSEGLTKMTYGQSQRVNSDVVIQETYMSEDRASDSSENPQKLFKADLRRSDEKMMEEFQEPNDRFQPVYQLDHRRNSDGIILMKQNVNERRNSDGAIRKYFGPSPKGNYERIMQRQVLYPVATNDEGISDAYRESERRSSDEISQDSFGIDRRRGSYDFTSEGYSSSERRDSDEVLRGLHWPYQRSDSGETIPENSWPSQRRDSDEYSQGSFPSNKDHFFENTLRREHKQLERLKRVVPIHDSRISYSSEHRSYYNSRPPTEDCPSVTSFQDDDIARRVDDEAAMQHEAMNWDRSSAPDTAVLHTSEQKEEDTEVPLDLSISKSSTKF